MTGEQQAPREVAVQSVRPIESVFVSYNRDDRTRVGELVDGLNRLGYRVWLDEDLSGGQDWWEAILGQIRACDTLLLVISPAELQSQACREEVGYARNLGKPVLPVLVQEVPIERLPPDLARLQLVDYTGRSRNEAFDLMVALRRLSTPAVLPDPLPAPPPVPMSYLNDLSELVDAKVLSLDQQFGLIGRLIPALEDPQLHDTAVEILERLNRRQDLYREPAIQLASVLRTTKPLTRPDEPADPGATDNRLVRPVTGGGELDAGFLDDQSARRRKVRALTVSGVIAVLVPLSAFALFGPLRPPTHQRPATSATPYLPTTAPTTPTPPVEAVGVPNVYKASEAQARAALNEAGYNVQIYRVCSSSVAAGYVRQAIEVNPDSSETILVDSDGVRPAGQQLAKGSTVTLKISTGVSCT